MRSDNTISMMRNLSSIFALFLFATAASPAVAEDSPNFQDHVLPIFKQHCNNCHNPDKNKADLDLTTVAGIQKGSSGGEVVRVGTPDSSSLYLAMDHEDGYESMPPKKPKLDEKSLAVVHAWIAGGMVPHAGGKSGLRDVSFDVSAGSAERPKDVAIPKGLADATSDPAPVLAVATSPWADVFAVAGHREVRLYAPADALALEPGFQPVAHEQLVLHEMFDGEAAPGVLHSGYEADGETLHPLTGAEPAPKLDNGFTIGLWVRPVAHDQMPKHTDFFGNDLFNLFLERSRNGYKVRFFFRDQDNRIGYFARQGEILLEQWSHVAVSYDGKDITTHYNGDEVSRQPMLEGFRSFRPSIHPLSIGGANGRDKENFRGGLDDLRIYSRALSQAELTQLVKNSRPQLGLTGALPFDLGAVHQLRFSPNGGLLLAAGGRGAHSGAVNLYDVKTGALQATIGDEQDIVLAADISPDHGQVAIGGPSRVLKVHATADGALQYRITQHTDWVTTVRFSPDGSWLASGDRNGAIHVWEAKSGGIVYSLSEHKEAITDIAWRPDSKVLATSGEDGKLVLWSMDDGFPLRAIRAHEKKTTDRFTRLTGILDVAYLPDGRLFTSGRDRALRLWATNGRRAKDIPSLSSLPLAAAVTHDGTRALTGQSDGSLILWDLFSGIPTELSTQQ